MTPTSPGTSVPGTAKSATPDAQNGRKSPHTVALSLPNEVIFEGLTPGTLGILIHLLACPRCFTASDLMAHGAATRAGARNALDELTRTGHYRRHEDPDDAAYVQIAMLPGAYGPWVCVSRVYFVERDDLIKIGTTVHLPERLRQLGYKGGPVTFLAAEPGGRVLECEIHQRFAKHHVGGEWFHPTRALRAYIRNVAARGEVAA